jgi:hypothetical protein
MPSERRKITEIFADAIRAEREPIFEMLMVRHLSPTGSVRGDVEAILKYELALERARL